MQSIERAFALLRALAVGPVGVTELAERVDLPKSTVARILAALENEGAVTQDGSVATIAWAKVCSTSLAQLNQAATL